MTALLPFDSQADSPNADGRSVAIIGTRGYPSFYGGFETLVRKLAPFLADHGWDVTVYGRPSSVVDSPEYLRPDIKTPTTWGVESKSLSTLTYGATSVFDATKNDPSVALVMNVANGYWLPLLRRNGTPSVVNVNGIEWERDKWSKLGKAVFKRGAHLTARYADVLVSDSMEISTFWEDNFDRGSQYIPYGGDIPREDSEPVDGLTKRGYVLLVARLVPENSVGEFVDAAERIARRYPVVIVGSSGSGGPLEERVRSLAESDDNVTWLGQLADDRKLYSLWQNCGAYFHGHSVGGTNPALVQAMACGAPTVARNTRFNREVLQDSGTFVEPRAATIADGILALMADPRRQAELSAKAQARAVERYSWDAICTQYEDALLHAMEGRTTGSSRSRTASVRK